MKVSHLIKALPLLALPIVIWQWSYIKNIAVAGKLSTSSEQQLATKAPNDQSSLPSDTWQVTSVSDGDTITVQQGSKEERIRFCGIDAPESSQPLGQESKMNLQELVDQAGGKVQLKIIESDRYDRKVAEVFTVLESGEQKLLQEKQLQTGLAMVYHQYLSNCPSKDVFLNVEEVAKQNRVGVWSDPSTVPPWEYRKVQRQQDTVNTNSAGDSISKDLEPDPGPTTASSNRAVSYANISLANTLEGHSDWVSSVAISPDGKILVSGSSDSTIKIWDLSTNGSLKSTIKGSNPINSVIVSPDGQTLISGDDNTIKIWDLGSGTEKSILTDSSGANVLAVSPDGQTLVSSTGKTIKIWDLNNGTLKNTITAHSSNIKFLSIELDGETLISGSEDGTSKEWDLSTGTLKKNTQWNFKDFPLAFSADRQISVSNNINENSKTINIRDVDSKSTEGTITTQASNLSSLAISPDKQTVVVSGYVNNNIIEVWRVL